MNWKPTTLKIILSLVIAVILTFLGSYFSQTRGDIILPYIELLFKGSTTLSVIQILMFGICFIISYSLYSLIQKKIIS